MRKTGFTLIELLVVISIIAILAGLLMPAVVKAVEKVRIQKAMTEMKNIEAAINQYQTTYGRLPASKAILDALASQPGCPDFTFGTSANSLGTVTLVDKKGKALPLIISTADGTTKIGYQANNSELMAILRDVEKYPSNGNSTPNDGHVLNPQKITFLEGKMGAKVGESGVGEDLVYRDPWGNPYIVTIDLNYDERCRDGFYRLASVSQDGALDKGFFGLYRQNTPANPLDSSVNRFEARGSVIVWSLGPDGKVAPDISKGTPPAKANVGVNKDNILTWK